MPRIQGARIEQRINFYDSFLPHRPEGPLTLFGASNIGKLALCNFLMPYCMVSDQTAFIDHWYARTDLVAGQSSLVDSAFALWAHHTTVTFKIGERPTWQKSMRDLLLERPWVPEERRGKQMTEEEAAAMVTRREQGVRIAIVPVRQNVYVDIDTNPELAEALADVLRRAAFRAPNVWVHVEGVSRRDVP
jgi:hypothetical protein